MIEVESSSVKALGYIPGTNVLLVEYKQGDLYMYITGSADAAVRLFNEGLEARSVGAYVVKNVAHSYPYIKVNGDQYAAVKSLSTAIPRGTLHLEDRIARLKEKAKEEEAEAQYEEGKTEAAPRGPRTGTRGTKNTLLRKSGW